LITTLSPPGRLLAGVMLPTVFGVNISASPPSPTICALPGRTVPPFAKNPPNIDDSPYARNL
jgi:hypothetical protein